jgi:hypothetical protein
MREAVPLPGFQEMPYTNATGAIKTLRAMFPVPSPFRREGTDRRKYAAALALRNFPSPWMG